MVHQVQSLLGPRVCSSPGLQTRLLPCRSDGVLLVPAGSLVSESMSRLKEYFLSPPSSAGPHRLRPDRGPLCGRRGVVHSAQPAARNHVRRQSDGSVHGGHERSTAGPGNHTYVHNKEVKSKYRSDPNVCLYFLSLSERHQHRDLQRGSRQVLHQVESSQGGHLLQDQTPPCGS